MKMIGIIIGITFICMVWISDSSAQDIAPGVDCFVTPPDSTL